MMDLPLYSMDRMHGEIQEELDETVLRVIHENRFVRGKETLLLEKEFPKFLDRKYGIACGNGLDALYMMLRAYGIKEGDEVIVPSNTFYATALAVVQTGAMPVFVEPDITTYNIDPALIEGRITERTKAIMVVHLYGQAADMDSICSIAKDHNLLLFEDASQAHGATYYGKQVGTFGNAAAFSCFPGKNLGAFGDAGMVVTDDADVADFIHAYGNYGSDYKYHFLFCGRNTRIDEINAAILTLKLKHLERWNENKRQIANRYMQHINNPKIQLPVVSQGNRHTWHIFALRCQMRDDLMDHLESRGIHTYIHYPIPMHLQPAFSFLKIRKGALSVAEEISETEISIPMWYGLQQEEIDYIIGAINDF